MMEQDPLMRGFFRALDNSMKKWAQLSPQQRLERSVGKYSNLAEFTEYEERENDWVTLHNLRHVDVNFSILRVHLRDVAQIPEYFPLPRQIFAGCDRENLKRFPTIFVRDGFPGTDYFCYFFVKKDNVGLLNGRLSGLSRYNTDRVKEAGVLVEKP